CGQVGVENVRVLGSDNFDKPRHKAADVPPPALIEHMDRYPGILKICLKGSFGIKHADGNMMASFTKSLGEDHQLPLRTSDLKTPD
ncbi:MAG: hypothetical protein AAGU11_16495, partial [Syntrophobacteraceae bacterium]